MRRMLVIALMAVSAGAASTPAAAFFANGDQLYHACTYPGDTPEAAIAETYCIGYVAGAADAAEVLTEGNICRPDDAIVADAQRIVVTYLEVHDERRADPAAELALTALREAWACPGRR